MINVDDFEDSLRSQIRDKVIEVLGEMKYGVYDVLIATDDIYTIDLRGQKYVIGVTMSSDSELEIETISFPALGTKNLNFDIDILVVGDRDGNANLLKRLEKLTSVVENILTKTKDVLLLNTSGSTIIKTSLGETNFEGVSDFSDSVYRSTITFSVAYRRKENEQFLKLT